MQAGVPPLDGDEPTSHQREHREWRAAAQTPASVAEFTSLSAAACVCLVFHLRCSRSITEQRRDLLAASVATPVFVLYV